MEHQFFEAFLVRFAADSQSPSPLGIKKNHSDGNVQLRLPIFRRNQSIEFGGHGFRLDHLLERKQEKEMAFPDGAIESSNHDL